MLWQLVPNRSVGDITFGQKVEKFLDRYQLMHDPVFDLPDDSKSYLPPTDEIRVDTEKDIVWGVSCYKMLIYKGHNLVGMSLDDVRTLLHPCLTEIDEETFQIGDEEQYTAAVPDLGLTLWLSEDDIIASVDCACNFDA